MLRMLIRDGDTEGRAAVGSHYHLQPEGQKERQAIATSQELKPQMGPPDTTDGAT